MKTRNRRKKSIKNNTSTVQSEERIKILEYLYFRLFQFFTRINSWAPDISAVAVISLIQSLFIGILANILQLPIRSKFATALIFFPIYIINIVLFSNKRGKIIERKFNNRTNVNARNETLKGWGIVILFFGASLLFLLSYGVNSTIDWSK